MYAQVEKPKEKKIRAAVNSISQKKSNVSAQQQQPIQKNENKTESLAFGQERHFSQSSQVIQCSRAKWIAPLFLAGVGAALIYYKTRGPKLYSNTKKDIYNEELQKYLLRMQQKKTTMGEGSTKGIVSHAENPDGFDQLLHEGTVLYVYDSDKKLKISADEADVKHAIVADNKDVRAAGHAGVIYTQEQANFKTLEYALAQRNRFEKQTTDNKQMWEKVFGNETVTSKQVQEELSKEEWTVQVKAGCKAYMEGLDYLHHYEGEVTRLEGEETVEPLNDKTDTVEIDNSSGHYVPSPESKKEALKGWKNAGYTNLKWRSHGE